ncbi:MAG TPA: ABC transporter ATP-binding protein [Solirubrobacteraceae bacterium]|nr:ABC transporter ATP-binding protein [Solirubrobacteraceae bacterium]
MRKRTELGYGAAVRLLWETSRPLSAAVALYALAASVLPIAVLFAAGHLVGDVPPAARHGLSSHAGHRMFLALGLTGAAYAGTLLLGPAQSALSSAVKWRLVYRTQDRLIAAVSRPIGIAHLEDPAVLDDLALAQGQLVNQMTADAPMTLALVISNRASGLIACGVLASLQWWLGLGMLVMWTIVRRPQLRLIREGGRLYAGNTEVFRRAFYLQRLAVLPDVAKESRVFGLGGWMVERYRSQALLGFSAPWRTHRQLDHTVLALAAAVLAAYAGACTYLGLQGYHHHIELATLAVMLPMVVATMSYGDISWDDVALSWMLQGVPRAGKLEHELASPADDLPGHMTAAGLPAQEVRFENVSFSYPSASRSVFEDLNLAIPAGVSTALVGLNGAGKTTLVKLLARLHDPDGGRIVIDGRPLSEFEPAAWQRQVAVVFQDFVHYPLTLRENVGWGAPAELDDADGLEQSAGRAGVPPSIGWDTVLSRNYEGGLDLSGGQWQRVALARALFAVHHGARLLVLDEPTAWLDARGEADFFDRFLDITAGTTSLIISHRFSTVRRADHICVLEGGRVLEQGDHDSLLAAGNRYAELFRLQAARYKDPA